ncbi:MAG: T9SS type A sorting domain-containing protein [Chitinophagaceae bacterium]|nr:T9SS type A sorting domain-containing protein [Chitinophagaceae bacterium]
MLWPSVAPSGADFYGSTAIPGWQNSLLITNLKKGTVARYKLSNDGQSIISDTTHYFRGLGRFRDVVVSADGMKIYVACDSSGSTSGPTGGVTTTPANPGSILEFTYVPELPVAPLFSKQVKEEVKDRTIDVYPNPASSYFIVYNYKETGSRIIELTDMNGRIVIRKTVTGTASRIETALLPNGLYILNVKDLNGLSRRTEKIIIKH